LNCGHYKLGGKGNGTVNKFENTEVVDRKAEGNHVVFICMKICYILMGGLIVATT
jgi:hypothetical protein